MLTITFFLSVFRWTKSILHVWHCFHGLTIGMVDWRLNWVFSWKTKSVFALNINKLQIYLSTRWFVTLCLYKWVSYDWAFFSSSFHFYVSFIVIYLRVETWEYSIRVYHANKVEKYLENEQRMEKRKYKRNYGYSMNK